MPHRSTPDEPLQDIERQIDRLAPEGRGHRADAPAQPFSRILVAVDGSAAAAGAAAWAGHVAAADRARVTALGVTPAPKGARDTDEAAVAEVFGGATDEAAAGVEDAVARLRERGIDVQGRVESGLPAEHILKAAAEADLVVLGARGLGRVERLLLGSVSSEVKDRCPVPVLVTRGDGAPRRVLVATDGSAMSRRAAAHAMRLAGAWGAQISVLHVQPLPMRDPGRVAEQAVGALLRDAAEGGLHGPLYQVVPGEDAAERIIAEATRQQADLVVVGSRGLGRVRSLLLGSVSGRVVREAPMSVLVVK